ncbi:MAG TPA: hypothetical protein VE604_00315 [Candidatus Polarisedimenticolia bacterium]|jgi:hypothetical protein|nr:hypothetical protein [Candidatus Polarisedimenticolia bacterium]
MDDKELTRIGDGFYVDDNRALYFKVSEFLTAHHLSDTPEVRRAIWEQIRHDFGVIGITELPEE